MAKKEQLFAIAEEMFVRQLANVADIAERLKVAEKTIRNWKAEGEWDRKRQELLREGSSIADRQLKIARRVADLIDKLLDAGEVPPRHLFAFLVSVGGGMERAREYEEASRPAAEEQQKGVVDPEKLRAARQLLGLE